MMRTAVIVMAHLGPATGIRLLAEYFSAADADLIVHVDISTDVDPYAAVAASCPHVTLIKNRRRCWWGGFNGARAVLDMLRTAIETEKYSRYLYITENTLPLRPRSEWLAAMEMPIDYIAASTHGADRTRYDAFYYWDCDAMTPRCCSTALYPLSAIADADLERLRRLRRRGKVLLPQLWQGCCHWALTQPAAEALVDRHEHDKTLRESFEFSMIPEEQYYHTILGQSGFLNQETPQCVYQDFSRAPAPFVYRRRSEFKALQAAPALFARKFDLASPDAQRFIRDLANA